MNAPGTWLCLVSGGGVVGSIDRILPRTCTTVLTVNSYTHYEHHHILKSVSQLLTHSLTPPSLTPFSRGSMGIKILNAYV